MTLEQYEALLAVQGGRCAICGGVNPSGRRLSVDHAHATKQVRGLLCGLCNRGLGAFRDDPILLRKAIGYLRRRLADLETDLIHPTQVVEVRHGTEVEA